MRNETIRIKVEPEIIAWLCERSGRDIEELTSKFKNLPEWQKGTVQPTLNQLKKFARAVYVPYGYLFLDKPLRESNPLKDFRISDVKNNKLSSSLLDTIHICQLRRDWYADYAVSKSKSGIEFIGIADKSKSTTKIADRMRDNLGIDQNLRKSLDSIDEFFKFLVKRVEKTGILVMVSGIVMHNTHRPLDPAEFLGFSLSDYNSPIIFINSRNTTAAQTFTLLNELAHLLLGESVLSNTKIDTLQKRSKKEIWCNDVASEILLPLKDIREHMKIENRLPHLDTLAEEYCTSKLVALRRLYDAELITQKQFIVERKILCNDNNSHFNVGDSNGSIYPCNAMDRVGKNFAIALITSTLEGNTPYHEAFKLLGVSNIRTFNLIAQKLGLSDGKISA